MARKHAQLGSLVSRYSARKSFSDRRAARVRLQYELLEPRHLLAAEIGLTQAGSSNQQNESIASITWFETIAGVERVPLKSLSSVDRLLPEGVAGPIPMAAGEWIVQLREDSARSVRKLAQADSLLDDLNNDFTIISGLGSRGAILLRADGPSRLDIEASLQTNPHVQSFQLNQLIQGQAATPNESDFAAGLLPGLTKINAEGAWDESIGSMSTVVGVVDSGIDPKHPDLYLNIWINQGELPPEFLDDDGNKLVDIDGDGLITFYDLNHATRDATAPYALTVAGFAGGPNAEFVRDLNNNGRIDADDLLRDARWTSGTDDDGNGFFDDIFGVNFRAGAGDPFASNNPTDELGHGTHVAGTIGAIGSNGTGVVGVNWQTSLMSLRILDNNNQGDSGAAIRAINYARDMRERLTINSANRVTEGASVKVLNNSWGQPGGYEASLESAIQQLYEANILFVAAAGNGNILGNGVDNDRTPFYPASYDVPNVIGVAAADASDRLATFSNFGKTSVDILAPGVGIRSTIPGGGYQSANGTSMAAPHVAGTAALIWSALPEATVDEVKQAILGLSPYTAENKSVDIVPNGLDVVATGGRLNAFKSIAADVFAPSARLVSAQNITIVGGTTAEFTVEYFHRSGFTQAAIEQSELLITRQWGYGDELTPRLKAGSVSVSDATAIGTYIVDAPGGGWDTLDFGDYRIETIAGSVSAKDNTKINQHLIGAFNVTISPQSDPTVIYVSTFNDRIDQGSLRDAIREANRRGGESTIILTAGTYLIELPSVVDPDSTFPPIVDQNGLIPMEATGSSSATGDFVIQSNITIVGSRNLDTIIDAQELDRIFRVSPDAKLTLRNITLKNGTSAGIGGAIFTFGDVEMDLVVVRDSQALVGSGIASLGGHTQIDRTRITENVSRFASIYIAGNASANLNRSTIDNNDGGGLQSFSSNDVMIETSTLSTNRGGVGAASSGFSRPSGDSLFPALNADGRFVAFESRAGNLIPEDNNGVASLALGSDIFVYDRQERRVERVSVNDAGEEGNFSSSTPALSADGRFVTFVSSASNLVAGDNNGNDDIFVYDRQERRIERVSVNDAGEEAGLASFSPSLSADGRFVAFESNANNLVPGDNNGTDIFVYDRHERRIERISVNDAGEEGNRNSVFPSISADGRFVTFVSFANNLVPGDNNDSDDIFVYDRQERRIERVSVNDAGQEGNQHSSIPSLSADGRFVTFHSEANNLVQGDTNGTFDIFVYDRQERRMERVSVNDVGEEGNGVSTAPSLSADGRFVTFNSFANNLVAGDNNDTGDIFVYDRLEQRIERVSVNQDGEEGNQNSSSPSLSDDGRFVTFESDANNLVQGDSNGTDDIFVYDRLEKRIETVINFFAKVVITSSTFIDNEAVRTVFGQVEVSNSLFAGNNVAAEADTSIETQSFNMRLNDDQRRLTGPLESDAFLPPTHRLLFGNPAINHGDPALAGITDQNNTPRDVPDVGAVEASLGVIRGITFADLNENAKLDTDEPLVKIGDIELARDSRSKIEFISVTEAGTFQTLTLEVGEYRLSADFLENWTTTTPPVELIPGVTSPINGGSEYPSLSAAGRFVAFHSDANNLVSGDNNFSFDVFVYDRQERQIERISVNDAGEEGNRNSAFPSISADGRFVTFVSFANNLVPGDNNDSDDIFVYDRQERRIERVSVNDAGQEGNQLSSFPSLSSDGRFVTFHSEANNLVQGDTNGTFDIFVYDRQERRMERVSVNDARDEGNGFSVAPSLSADGRFVTFYSFANNLVPGDNNGTGDIFVYDRLEQRIERVSVNQDGEEGNQNSSSPSLSADGRFVTFESDANNLVQGDNNGTDDIFVYDRLERSIERISVNDAGGEGNHNSLSPSVSADGRFVTFESDASNLVSGDNNQQNDIFIYDRHLRRIARVSLSDTGVEANSFSYFASLSDDGRWITFNSFASNLVREDSNGFLDVFLIPNPFLPPSVSVALRAGETVDVEIPLKPNPGTISGQLFVDIAVLNEVFDFGEDVLANYQVFLDSNGNGRYDAGEMQTLSNAAGYYQFDDVPAFRNQTIVVTAPTAFEQIAPERQNQPGFTVFLPAGGNLNGIDFGFRPIQSTGQSSRSEIYGQLFIDKNDNGQFDIGIDEPLTNREVFLDASNFGVRDESEPRRLTDAQGRYAFDGLSARNVAVTTVLDETLVHVNPLGSNFGLNRFPLFGAVTPFGNPQAIASGDFNQDGFLDVAVALGEANKLSIRLNDGMGGFLPEEIDIDLGTTGAGPTSLVVGQFDNDTKLDVALTANFTGNVTILRNFDPVTKSFQPPAYVKVGDEPLEIAAGQLGGDAKLDLVVVNKAGNTVQVLTNNGSGVFTAGPGVPTGGRNSSSIVVGNFTGDASLDVAVVHASPLTTANPFGGVTLLRGDDAGGLTLDTGYYTVGATPTDAVVGDFNKDGRPDIAVSNFATNSISILLGQADGTMRVQTDILGTASGAFDITAGDIDNDGDIDVIASNLQDRNISIFRNIGVIGGDVQFEPLENVGLGQFTLAQRMPLLVGNFDRDTSGPGGMGTIDIVTIPQRTDTLHVLTNTLVNGAHRVALTGLNVVSGRDFIIKPAILPPLFDPIADPPAVVEGSAQQAVLIRGIQPGRAGGPPLQFSATSSNSSLIASPSVAHSADGTTATVRYTPLQNANGSSVITVRATDAGADGIFDTADDGILTRSFTVTVLAVNDRIAPSVTLSTNEPSPTLNVRFKVIAQFSEPVVGLVIENVQVSGGHVERIDNLGNGRFELAIAATSGSVAISLREAATHDLAGNSSLASMILRLSVGDRLAVLAPTSSGQSIDLTSMSDSELLDVETIDLRGFGDNLLTLDSAKIQSLFANASVTIYADPGDTIAFDGDWLFGGIELIDGAIHRIFTEAGATILVNGPLDYTNPDNQFDVDGSGEVVALDALLVLTTIRNKRLADASGIFLPITENNQADYRFVDVNRDNLATPLDALFVLNEIRRIGREGNGASGEQVVAPMQSYPTIVPGISMSSMLTEDRDARTPESFIAADASQYPAATVSYGPQQWRVDTIEVSDDKKDGPSDLVSMIDEAFADPLLLD